MHIDPYILAFSALTVIATIWMGFWSAKKSKTAHDFFVAGRSVSVGWNASAISGEYLSAASFMGVAGMVMSSGYDALWYPVCYACGYLFLLLFIAGPLRRFGAYTIPDFAEGRYDSPVFRKIAVVFVLFIGFFYTMPQMKGAGTTLAYIFQDVDLRGTFLELLAPHKQGEALKGFPYWAGVLVVGAVITLNVALGGMKGITLVQAFQYWLKMFAISVPVFVLMVVYGDYGRQIEAIGQTKPSGQTGNALALADLNIRFFDAQNPPGIPKPRDAVTGLAPIDEWLNKATEKLKEYKERRNLRKAKNADSVSVKLSQYRLHDLLALYGKLAEKQVLLANIAYPQDAYDLDLVGVNANEVLQRVEKMLTTNGVHLLGYQELVLVAAPAAWTNRVAAILSNFELSQPKRKPLPELAPSDATWLNPFGPLTTKAAKAAKPAAQYDGLLEREDVDFGGTPWRARIQRVFSVDDPVFAIAIGGTRTAWDLVKTYADYTLLTERFNFRDRISYLRSEKLKEIRLRCNIRKDVPSVIVPQMAKILADGGVTVVREPGNVFKAFPTADAVIMPVDPKPLALLYTYSLIIALVCGTAGLPHILVRFYTNPDGVAAKRTTMWVMILIGVFYLFPPIFGVMGRNLSPELYAGTGAKGTDKVVLELPRILNREDEKTGTREDGSGSAQSQISSSAKNTDPQSQIANRKSKIPWGSILSGITCAGAFAAFMSTFSGLLVSMTGALAHDVYGRMLRPNSTPQQRLRMFRWSAVMLGAGSIVAGMQVEPFQINFMVGQAFAIAAASYFPLLFMSSWWRGMTMKGAAAGMMAGGLSAVTAISLTSFSDLKWLPLDSFWAAHPLLRILCEQPALWTVPLAIALMVAVSKLTRKEMPSDIRMKMLVLHAPEKLGLKQEYIQEHQHGH
ncbi:MAG: cation acetate symporter [Verrucomicrobia bacterium]|nr:cation acetate symporter [Verrucomicrobiota bacterium]